MALLCSLANELWGTRQAALSEVCESEAGWKEHELRRYLFTAASVMDSLIRFSARLSTVYISPICPRAARGCRIQSSSRLT